MDFSSASLVEQVVWDMRLADQPRGDNRAQIDRLFNGFPPWTPDEADSAQINTNVNFLDAPKLAADARRSYYNAFLKPRHYFSLKLEAGPHHQRSGWSAIVTNEMNRIMKESLVYFEVLRSQIANTVLHGKGIVHWPDAFSWKPKAVDIVDLLIPSNTLLSLENLTYFAIFRQYTAPELSDMIERKNVDPGWNVSLARKAVAWCLSQNAPTAGTNDWLSSEKIIEQFKQDSVYFASDVTPTVDCWDFYFLDNSGKKSGWKRRIILDTPAHSEIAGGIPETSLIGEKRGEWLYTGGNRIFAENINQVLHFQFGDLSPKGPFKYHSVRSLGWLIYAVCNLQNRLRCKINDATFENLLNYFRVATPDEAERLTKIDLHNYGVLPEGIDFVKQAERWQINHALVGSTINDNRSMLNEAAAQFREGRDTGVQREKTATEIMAEVNSANALVGTMLLLGYTYQKPQYTEITRRFFVCNSDDPEVRKFHLRVLKQGVPYKYLDPEFWTVTPEQVIGSGNKMLQIAMADKLMAVRPLLDPEIQRDVLRLYVEANSDDPGLGSKWVPENPVEVSKSTHDAQLMIGTIMTGATVLPAPGQDAVEISKALLIGMAEICKRIVNSQPPTFAEITGLTNLAITIEKYLQIASGDVANKQFVSDSTKELTQLAKLVQKWSSQVQQAQQPTPEDGASKEMALTQAKLQGIALQAQTKAQITRANAAQKQSQRQAQFEQRLRQDEEAHNADLRKKLKDAALSEAVTSIKTSRYNSDND